MTIPFLDTNVFLRHLLQDEPRLSAKATAIFAKIEQGELQVRTSETVIFEAVFTLQKSYRQPRDLIARGVLSLLELPGIALPGKRTYREAFDLYCQSSLGFADCYHVALMRHWRTSEILSFDTHFDKVPGIIRREG